MLLDEKIIECELEYTRCFSGFRENENTVRFRDNELQDMYYHNYTYIKRAINDVELKNIIEEEISFRIFEKSDFCNLVLNDLISSSVLTILKYKPEITTNGYYSYDISKHSKLKTLSDCTINKVENQEMIEDLLDCDLQHDEETIGKDFCTRRCYRRGKEYISDKNINSYICYHKGEIIGNCDLFMHRGVAKIEDFAIIPKYQRKGYGTTILKELIKIAIKEKAHTIYLVTDEEDTAKEMYKKIGFNKMGEKSDLFFELDKE